MICSNCNTMNADGMKFCSNCGAPLGSVRPVPQMTQPRMTQPQMRRGNSRLHLLLSILAFLWYPLMFLLWVGFFVIVAAVSAGAVLGSEGANGAAWQMKDFVTVASGSVLVIAFLLGVVVRVGSLVASIRAKARHYPNATLTLVLSVLALIGALFVDLFLIIFGMMGITV
ncbi:MAG: zinc ribbon domain-containing protein [Lachnospiraceae bacterium]|nr:zinc ribbon domain-containing protein [Lachnospiraceae bacterium]